VLDKTGSLPVKFSSANHLSYRIVSLVCVNNYVYFDSFYRLVWWIKLSCRDYVVALRGWCPQDRGDSVLETILFIRRVSATSFRAYTVQAENQLGLTTHSARLVQSKLSFHCRFPRAVAWLYRGWALACLADAEIQLTVISTVRRSDFKKWHVASIDYGQN